MLAEKEEGSKAFGYNDLDAYHSSSSKQDRESARGTCAALLFNGIWAVGACRAVLDEEVTAARLDLRPAELGGVVGKQIECLVRLVQFLDNTVVAAVWNEQRY
jgi:hypothetical protein